MSDGAAERPRRLHPISPVFELIAASRQLAIPLFAAVFAGEWWFAAPIALVTGARCLSWLRFTYHVDGDFIRVHEGLLVRKQRTVALDRVQQVDIVSKLRHRVMGVVGLNVDTASGARGAELKLEVVSKAEAARLRGLLLRHAPSARVDEASSVETEESAPAAERASVVVSVSPAQLALAGITGAQTLVILSIVFSLQELLDFVNVDRVRTLVPEGVESQPAAIAGAVVTLGLLWLALAAASMILTHYGYTLRTVGDQFRVTRGLLDRREVGGTLSRVQAVRIEQTFIRRMLGFAAVRVQTAAVPGQSVTKIVIPFVPVADLERVARAMLPALPPWPELEKPPRAALTLGLIRRVPATAAAALVVTLLFWPWGAFALLAIPVAVTAAALHFGALGHAWHDGTLWARHGGLFRETVIVPAAKAQSLRLTASWLQRRAGVAMLRVDVAGRGSTPRVQDVPLPDLEPIVAAMPTAAAADERTTRLVKALAS